MEAEVTHAERVRQSQLALAEGMKISPENLKVLEKVGDWKAREWMYVCALDGMNIKEILEKSSDKLTVSYIKKKRGEYFRSKYVTSAEETKKMRANLEELQREVEKTCEESRKVREAVVDMIADRKKYAQIEQALKEKEEIIQQLQEDIHILKKQDEITDKVEKGCSTKKLKIRFRFSDFFRERSRLSETKKFIESYLKDEKFSRDQVEFMLGCLEEGMEIKEIECFAIPGISVEMMRRLKDLQKKEHFSI